MSYRDEVRVRAKAARDAIRPILSELHSQRFPQFDDVDRDIVARRVARRENKSGPRVGDFIRFVDDVTRRISHIWGDGSDPKYDGLQTSSNGSYHLCESGHLNFSGSLYPPVPFDSLQLTDTTRMGRAWIFHHDHWTAHNDVVVEIPCRVYVCSLPAT